MNACFANLQLVFEYNRCYCSAAMYKIVLMFVLIASLTLVLAKPRDQPREFQELEKDFFDALEERMYKRGKYQLVNLELVKIQNNFISKNIKQKQKNFPSENEKVSKS